MSTRNFMRHWANLLGIAAALALASSVALAQGYPTKPLRFIVPYPAGGTTDALARLIGQKLSESLGQPVVIENKPGAGGNVGAEMAAKAAPDGYTIIMAPVGTIAINISLYSKLAFDPVKDFVPVTMVATNPLLLVVHPSVAANSIKELVALAQSNPGQLNFGSGGNGTSMHLAGELLKSLGGIDMVHVPYNGSAPCIAALLAGQVQMSFDQIVTSMPQVKAGKLRAIGVSSAKRSPIAPDVPTLMESGLTDFEVSTWTGVFAPAATPREIVARLNTEIVRILKMPDVRQSLLRQGAEPVGDTSEEFAAYIKSEIAKWAKVVKASGARVD
jgi:tripartite-type tricarboxylate transporter receptor subunit TctC